MTKVAYQKVDYKYEDQVKEAFVQSYKNIGSLETPEIGNKLSQARRVFLNINGGLDSVHYYHDEELGLRSIFEFDGDSATTEIIYGSNSSIQKTIIHTYQQEGKFEFLVLDAGNSIAEKGFKLTDKELVTKEQYDYYGPTRFETDFKYDNNLLIRQTRIREGSDLIYDICYLYIAFDEFGNWTKRLITHLNEEGKVTFSSLELSEYKYYNH